MTAFADTFPPGEPCEPDTYAPTGEPYLVFSGFVATVDGAEAAAHAVFEKYRSEHAGSLYWRIRPETQYYEAQLADPKWGTSAHPAGYSFYMRLLISDKEIKK